MALSFLVLHLAFRIMIHVFRFQKEQSPYSVASPDLWAGPPPLQREPVVTMPCGSFQELPANVPVIDPSFRFLPLASVILGWEVAAVGRRAGLTYTGHGWFSAIHQNRFYKVTMNRATHSEVLVSGTRGVEPLGQTPRHPLNANLVGCVFRLKTADLTCVLPVR